MSKFQIDNDFYLRHSIKRILERARLAEMTFCKAPGLSDKDEAFIATLAATYETWMRRLKKASLSGNNAKCKKLVRDALSDSRLQTFCYLLVHRDTPLKDLDSKKLSRKWLEKVGQRLNPFTTQKGVIHLKVEPKANGGKRILQSFPNDVQALQLLVADILIATGHRNPFDFNERWRGPNSAARNIACAIEEGFRHWLCADVYNYYPSVRPNKLRHLKLPWQVMKFVVCVNGYLPMEGGTEEEKKMARRGLPQGSPSSNVIASDLIGRVFQALPGTGISKQSFTDDLAIGARDFSTIKQIEAQLKLDMGQHPAGPFSFKECRYVRADRYCGPIHAGYHYRVGWGRLAGQCRIMPSMRSWERLFAKTWRHLEKASPIGWDKIRAEVGRVGRRWRMSKSAWPHSFSSDQAFAITLDQLASDYTPGKPYSGHPTLGYKLSQHLFKSAF